MKITLTDVDTSELVIRIDNEKAMVNAIKSAFPEAQHVLCTRHLRQNANQKLIDAAVDKYDKKLSWTKSLVTTAYLRSKTASIL